MCYLEWSPSCSYSLSPHVQLWQQPHLPRKMKEPEMPSQSSPEIHEGKARTCQLVKSNSGSFGNQAYIDRTSQPVRRQMGRIANKNTVSYLIRKPTCPYLATCPHLATCPTLKPTRWWNLPLPKSCNLLLFRGRFRCPHRIIRLILTRPSEMTWQND